MLAGEIRKISTKSAMAMVTPLSLRGIQQQTPHLPKSNFLGHSLIASSSALLPKTNHSSIHLRPIMAKFNLFEIMGGRGLCNGEEGIQKELNRLTTDDNPPQPSSQPPLSSSSEEPTSEVPIPENAFDKELLGLTGGFPGGEKGLRLFLEKNPPPPPKKPEAKQKGAVETSSMNKKKVKPPELPLLLPGMIALVKNPNNPYYMMCGIVQRITDGRAGVLFEGGNWDRLITFRLEELERREKGPPMVSPRSVMLEGLMEKEQ